MFTNNASRDLEEWKSNMERAVEDQLGSVPGDRIEIQSAVREIISYVFHNVDPLRAMEENERYAWYYELLGRSIAIAQGWKDNRDEIGKDALSSVQFYIEKTYGRSYPVTEGR